MTNELDANGDLARIAGKRNSTATEQMYATAFSYFPDGKIEKLKLGNNLWESAKLNSRLQVTELAMGHSVGDGGLMKLNYEYGELQTNGTVDATKNAGNIAKQTVNFTGLANPFVQTYKYDSLDRITEATEKVNGTQSWKQTFGYDVYGNRNSFYQIIGSQVLTINNLTLPTVEPSTNRFSASQGYGYDKNGNITADPANSGRTFIFNGDNKQKEVKNSSNVTIGTYLYDGQGKRVKKISDLETTIFVYDGLGKLVAEYSTATPPSNPTVSYTATDQLGSPRVLTNSFGEVVSRRDFMPFGEELYADGTYRKTGDKYSTTGQDAVRKRFTGYEKDLETGLDFAEARYYNDQHGRFTAVDPLLASGKSADPQTFNRYVYCLNNPIIFMDPLGLQTGKRVYVGTVEGKINYTLRTSRPEGYKPVTSERRVNADDGFTYSVNSRSIIGVGKWNQNVATPSQGIDTSVTPPGQDNTRALINELGARSEGSMHMIGALAGGAVVGGLIAAPAAATGGLVFAGTIVGEALLSEQAIRQNANNGHEATMRGSTSTLEPGPYAGESIEARGADRNFTAEERQRTNQIGADTGCHTCGTRNPGTATGNFIPDHQPPSAMTPDGVPQRLFPQCLDCSRTQGGQVRWRPR